MHTGPVHTCHLSHLLLMSAASNAEITTSRTDIRSYRAYGEHYAGRTSEEIDSMLSLGAEAYKTALNAAVHAAVPESAPAEAASGLATEHQAMPCTANPHATIRSRTEQETKPAVYTNLELNQNGLYFGAGDWRLSYDAQRQCPQFECREDDGSYKAVFLVTRPAIVRTNEDDDGDAEECDC
jgi:hypothetical protein